MTDVVSENPNQIARTKAGNYLVSTIFLSSANLALDDSLTRLGELVFSNERVKDHPEAEELKERFDFLKTNGDYETMVFHCDEEGEPTDWTEVDAARYDSEEEALDGHRQMVERWSNEA